MQVLRSYGELGQWASAPVVISVGFFDGVHRGHRRLISELREQAAAHSAKSLLITFSNSPRQFHDPGQHWQFLMTPEEKLYALSRSGVDAVLMLQYDDSICRQSAAMFLKGLAHFVELRGAVFGYDTSIGSDLIRGEAALQQLCAELEISCSIVPPFRPDERIVKSSLLRSLIREGRVGEAAELMGHPYFVLSRVVRGRGNGQELLAIPTANQRLAADKLAPLEGIYAGSAALGRRYLPAAICVMDIARARSTVAGGSSGSIYDGEDETAVIVESHILDFHEDIYDTVFRLDFHRRIREWRDFDSVEALRETMQEDIRITRELSLAAGDVWEKLN